MSIRLLQNKLCVAFTLLVIMIGSACHAGGLRTVALSGNLIPGSGGGSTYHSFSGTPTLNNRGEIAFRASVSGGPDGLFIAEASSLPRQIIEAGNPTTGISLDFNSPTINDSGMVAFYSRSSDIKDLWITDSAANNYQLLAEVGGQAPGLPAGVSFSRLSSTSGISFAPPLLTTSGDVVFFGKLTGPGIDGTNKSGIWSGNATDGINLIMQLGDPAPGTDPGTVFYGFSTGFNSGREVAIDAEGNIAFGASLAGDNVGESKSSLWKHSASTGLSLVAREDGTVPGLPDALFHGFGTPVLNSQGDLAFYASIKNSPLGSQAIMVNRGGQGLEVFALTSTFTTVGFPAPGTDGIFHNFGTDIVMNESGHLAFIGGVISINSGNHSGIWSEKGNGELQLVALEGAQAPGVDAGITFTHFQEDPPVMNANGQTAFYAKVNNGMTWDDGLWAEDINGNLQLIVREGGMLDVDDGIGIDLREVSSFSAFDSLNSSGNDDGRPSGFNDLGQVVFSARFTDGTSGIFVSNAAALSGDYNNDGFVDAADYTVWRDTLGDTGANLLADGDHNGTIDQNDYDIWVSTYGQTSSVIVAVSTPVPEPNSAILLGVLLTFGVLLLRNPERPPVLAHTDNHSNLR